jgi:hypothetical protein
LGKNTANGADLLPGSVWVVGKLEPIHLDEKSAFVHLPKTRIHLPG